MFTRWLRIGHDENEPTAERRNRGTLTFRRGGSGVADKLRLLRKNTADTYERVDLAVSSDLHDAVTVSDTASVDLTLTGQDISAAVLPAGVDHNSLANLTTGDPHTQYVEKSGDTMTGPLIVGISDAGALVVRTTGGTVLFQVDTTGGDIEILNGGDVAVYSDNGVTLKFAIDGATGNFSTAGNILALGDVTLGNAAGDTVTVTGTPTFAQNSTFQQDITVQGNATLGDAASDDVTVNGHLIGPTTGPSIAVEAGAGAGASASITGNDNWGVIGLTTGTGAGTGEQFTVTFGTARPDQNYGAFLFPREADSAGAAARIYTHSEATTHWDMNVITTPLADSTHHQWNYLVVEW